MDIRVDDLSGAEIAHFLEEHLRDMHATSPPESIHALDLSGLRRPEITFWSVWEAGQLIGCGALKALDAAHVEIKSMRTHAEHRGRGVARRLLQFMLNEARVRGFRQASIETGSMAFFAPARRLYQRHGFRPCPPFASYVDDPNSVFMTREL